MVRQFLAIAVAFSLMPFWSKKKLGFGPMLLITGLILSLIAGVAPVEILNNFVSVFTTPSTLNNNNCCDCGYAGQPYETLWHT